MANSNNVMMKQIGKAFQLQGLVLRGDAMWAIVSVLNQEADPRAALGAMIVAFKEKIDRHELRGSIIDEAAVKAVVVDLSNTKEDIERQSLTVMHSFAIALSSPALS